MKRTLGTADKVFAVSECSSRSIKRIQPEARIELVYNGVDVHHFTPGEAPKGSLVLTAALANAESIVRKGLATFVRQCKAFPKSGSPLSIHAATVRSKL